MNMGSRPISQERNGGRGGLKDLLDPVDNIPNKMTYGLPFDSSSPNGHKFKSKTSQLSK